MRPASKLPRETSLVRDRCVPVPETSTNAETTNEEPETGPIIAVDADGLVEPNAATGAPELIARARAILRLDRALKTVEAELARLVAFIKRGTVSETVQQELGASEARRRALRMALDRLAQADAFRASAADLAQKLGTILGDWTDITRKPVAQQRQLLRKLVPDRLTVTPHVDAKRRWVDRRWWPQGSSPCLRPTLPLP
jgi:hypothetical protein